VPVAIQILQPIYFEHFYSLAIVLLLVFCISAARHVCGCNDNIVD
jgi:hypothetical protein